MAIGLGSLPQVAPPGPTAPMTAQYNPQIITKTLPNPNDVTASYNPNIITDTLPAPTWGAPMGGASGLASLGVNTPYGQMPMASSTTGAPTSMSANSMAPMMASSTMAPPTATQYTGPMSSSSGGDVQEIIQRFPPELAPYFEQLAAAAYSEAARPYNPYGGQRIAQFTPNELVAQQMATGFGLAGDPNQSIDAYNVARNASSGVLGLADQLGLDAMGGYADMAALSQLYPDLRQQALVGGQNALGGLQTLRDAMVGAGQSFADVAGQGYANADMAAENAVGIGNAYGDYANAAAQAGEAGTGRATAIADMISGDLYDNYNQRLGDRTGQIIDVADAYAFGPNSEYVSASQVGQGGFNRLGSIADRAANVDSIAGMDYEQYMNPYMDQVIRDQENSIIRNSRRLQSELGSRAAMSGAFGGDRQAILDQGIADDALRQISQVRNAGMSEAYDRAQQAFEQDRQATFQGIGQQLQGQQAAEGSLQYGQAARDAALRGRMDALRTGVQQDQSMLGGISDLLGRKLQAEQQAQNAREFGASSYGAALDRQLQAANAANAARQYSTGLAGDLAGQNLAALQAAANTEAQGFNALNQGQSLGLQALGQQLQGTGQANELLGQFRNQQLGAYGQAQGLAGLLGNLGAQSQQMQLGRIGALENVGLQQRGLQQASLDMGYDDFLRQRDFNQQSLGFLSNILRGMPVGPTQQTSIQQQNPGLLQSMFNTGVAGLGLYNAYQGQ